MAGDDPPDQGAITQPRPTQEATGAIYAPPRDWIDSTAGFFGLEPALVRAVIAQESRWDPCAVSRRGAVGLCQLMPWLTRGMEDPFDPEENVRVGCQHLAACIMDCNGDIHAALRKYYTGRTGIRGWWYANQIMKKMKEESNG